MTILTTPLHKKSSNDRPASPLVQEISADPARTLAWLCVGALLLQGWWARWLARWAEEQRVSSLPEHAAREMREHEEAARLATTRPSLVDWEELQKAGETAAWTGTVAVVYWSTIVLFGAPLTSHVSHSILFALLLALLTVLPATHTLHPPTSPSSVFTFFFPTSQSKPQNSSPGSLTRRLTWVRLFVELAPANPVEVALVYPAVGAVIGAWVGVIPLALDWDRPWQAYPLPSAYLAILGSVLGSLAAVLVSSVRYFAALGRARHVPAVAKPPVDASEDVEKRSSGQKAVEEMRRSVQGVLEGMGKRGNVKVRKAGKQDRREA